MPNINHINTNQPLNQSVLYTAFLEHIKAEPVDFELYSDKILGIEYYVPNDEYDYIIAVCHKNKLAHRTEFLEMDDFLDGKDYAQVVVNGVMGCRFEIDPTL